VSKSLIPGVSLHTAILLGLLLGAACGTAVNVGNYYYEAANGAPLPFLPPLLTYVMKPAGQVFLRLLLMTVVPLVFASLAVGVAQLGDLRRLGRVGLRTFAFFIGSMSLAVTIGLLLVNTIEPGKRIDETTRQNLEKSLKEKTSATEQKPAAFGIDTFVNIIPKNPLQAASQYPPDMLGVIFFALMFGIGMTRIPKRSSRVLLIMLNGLNEVMVFIIGVAMLIAPFGVFALIFSVTAEFGFGLLKMLFWYVVVVLVGLAIQMFGTLSVLVWTLARLNPLTFFRKVRDIMITAFSTSSSNATLPTSIKVSEEQLGIPPQIAGFVLPLGATMNMNGTALFEGVTVLTLAQLLGVSMPLEMQLAVIVLSVLTAIGAAGVPGGSIPLLMMVLYAVNVPPEAIGLILGIDRLLDMCRTTLNVTGDVAAAAYVTRAEGYPLLQPNDEPRASASAPVPLTPDPSPSTGEREELVDSLTPHPHSRPHDPC
jgi:DAACS family dicarboxylate/amino acid:cation (Na+ or H+) symporter